MRLSTRGRYAVMALVELAARERDRQNANDCHAQPAAVRERPVSLAEIAQAQQLSVAYLEQLFARLRRAGLVDSARGPGGGYRLARAAEEIAIGAIIEAVDEPISATRCEEGAPGCLAGNRCLTHDLWHELGEQIRLFLESMTLADVVEGRVCGRAVMPLRGEAVMPLRGEAVIPLRGEAG
ncbi:Rrf2 family transcriptional regulator [Roseomonas sp. GC11]|uniref:Rrf2 family transcriptional regulator n=1 Tax=Roseomonas sp. GC11 TaxID=2950546 RepID=UPI00210D8E2E|nr:Rrf2 family transcriptional regulator [Roseomonas sp. GC11]MCQ4161882.1 Rrf2 family transcriptional regulator [Roseomonas sp. GC11]